MKNKGFTLTELLATIVILGIISTIAVVSYNKYVDSSTLEAYHDIEKSVSAATDSYFTYCEVNSAYLDSCKSIPSTGTSETTTLDELIQNGFMEKVMDPKGDNECSATVTTTNSLSNGVKLSHKVCLICGTYRSSDCN